MLTSNSSTFSEDLLKCREGIKSAYKNGTFLFLICGGYQLMGKYYRDADGNEIKVLVCSIISLLLLTAAESAVSAIS